MSRITKTLALAAVMVIGGLGSVVAQTPVALGTYASGSVQDGRYCAIIDGKGVAIAMVSGGNLDSYSYHNGASDCSPSGEAYDAQKMEMAIAPGAKGHVDEMNLTETRLDADGQAFEVKASLGQKKWDMRFRRQSD